MTASQNRNANSLLQLSLTKNRLDCDIRTNRLLTIVCMLQCSNEDYQNKILSKTDIWYCNLNITMLLVYWRFSLKRKYIIYTTSVVFIHHLLKPNDPISMMFSTTWMTPFVAGMSMLITLEPSIFNRSKSKIHIWKLFNGKIKPTIPSKEVDFVSISHGHPLVRSHTSTVNCSVEK